MNQRTHSGLGIASFATSLVSAILVLALLVVAGIMEASAPAGLDEQSPAAIGIGCSMVLFLLCALVALGLGIGALFQKDRHKVFPILGVVVSALTLFLTLALLVIGLIVG